MARFGGGYAPNGAVTEEVRYPNNLNEADKTRKGLSN